jgi:DNA invertase Pin-like site-specific DNA recombinase
MNPPVAYSYMRFSTPDQHKGDSIRRQTVVRDQFIERNKLRLDTTLTFVDAGVSGHRGKHRSSDKYALGHFLSLVRSGRITSGSYLIVESLDRLSREDVDEALELLLSLTRSGIKVVQLLPAEVVYQKPVEPMKLMMGIMELSRGNSESRMKSERIGAAWEGKRQKAREQKIAVSKWCPHWLKKNGAGYEVIPERVATVRRIFELSADGFGINGIIRKLVAEGRQPFGRSKQWNNSYLGRILAGRMVLGEYQPLKDKKPCGEPIPGYYPAVIAEPLFYRVQAGLKERLNHGSGRSVHDINLFQGLMYHALDGDKFEYKYFTDYNRGKKYGHARYVNSLALIAQANLASFPVAALEKGVLSCLSEIDPVEVLPRHDSAQDESESLSARYEEALQRLRDIESQMADPANGDSIGVLTAAANKVGKTVKELGERLVEARMKAANPHSEAWGTCHTLISALESADDREAARVRLKKAIRRVVERMVCLFVRNGRRQIACVQFHFTGSTAIRTVFVQHRGELVNVKETTPAYVGWSTLRDELPGKVDISKQHTTVMRVLKKMCEEEHWQKAFEPARPTSRERIRLRKQKYMRTYRVPK